MSTARASGADGVVVSAAHLSVRGVSKSFGTTGVLQAIDLEVARGEFVTLLGPSGCGKTTLLRIIAGLEVADAGEVSLAGERLNDLPANKRPVNTVFQSYALFGHLSVFENVAFGLRARGTARREVRTRVDAALQLLQIGELERRHPGQLSGGQKQRVALARALVNEPEVLLLDEPMSALDAKLRAEVQVELRRLQRRIGKTFILVTHDQDEAMTVSDRIFVMQHGAIAQHGRPAEVYEHPRSRFVAEFLGAANLLACRGAAVHETFIVVQTLLGQFRVDFHGDLHRGTFKVPQTIAIRPERIRVHASRPSVNAIEAKVIDVVYRGDHRDVFVAPGPLRVHVTDTLPLAPEQAVWLSLPPEHLEVLDD